MPPRGLRVPVVRFNIRHCVVVAVVVEFVWLAGFLWLSRGDVDAGGNGENDAHDISVAMITIRGERDRAVEERNRAQEDLELERRTLSATLARAEKDLEAIDAMNPQDRRYPPRVRKGGRRVFVDVGAFQGGSINLFRTRLSTMKNNVAFEMFAWEPQTPSNNIDLVGTTFISKAAWTCDTHTKLAVAPGDASDAILMEDPALSVAMDGRRSVEVPVDTKDFASWVQETFARDDLVVVHIDVGGVEYTLLQDMMARGAFRHVDIMAVDFYPKNANMSLEQHVTLMETFVVRHGIRLFDWKDQDILWWELTQLLQSN